jgi:hypothetical protein
MSPTNLSRVAACLVALTAPSAVRCAEKVQVTVLSILATDKSRKVDDRLKEIAEEVRKKEPKLTGFRLERIYQKSHAPGQCETVKLVDKECVDLCVNEKTDAEGRVTLTIKPPEMGEITYACRCGAFFLVVTNYRTAGPNRERLIIAVMARPCTRDKKK